MLFCCLLGRIEWWRYFKHPPPYPVFASIFALIVVTFSGFKIRKSLKSIKALKLGRDGERAVGQYLDDELRGQGHKIYHDIIGDNFNVDHVIISKKGIFAVETKTYSKPKTGQSKIYFDGQQLTIDALGKTNKPIIQVIAASKWLKNILQETTGKKFAVKPILLFPGWFIESTKEGKKTNIWVLNPKALPTFLKNQPDIISQEDMKLASFHISRYIRTKQMSV